MHNTFKNYLWTCKINISEFTPGEEHFITLREPTIAEFKEIVKLQKTISDDKAEDYEVKLIEVIGNFCDICCTLITDHDFFNAENENTTKLSSKEIAEFMKMKIDLAQAVLKEYMQNLPLLQASKKR